MTDKKQEKTNEVQLKLEEQQKMIEDYTNTLKRLQADFENYVKRVDKEKKDVANYSTHKLVSKLLTIADHFDKALDALKDTDAVKGIEMMRKDFHKILKEEGVEPIDALNEKLDPYKHEVIDVVIGEKDDFVIDEIQKGYMIKDKVLRPSKVRISKNMEEN